MSKRIYFLNKGIGKTNSGVEHAEKYRYDALKKNGHDVKVILVEPYDDVYSYAQDLGIEKSDVISVYDYFVGNDYKNPAKRISAANGPFLIHEGKNGKIFANREENNYFGKVETKDYTDAFFSRADMTLQFLKKFAKSEKITENDVLVVDRGDIDAPAVLAAELPWKIGFVVHAEHRSPDPRDQQYGYMLYNNYYQFEFDHSGEYDYIVTATENERKQLIADFEYNGNTVVPVFTIPVGQVSDAVLKRKKVPMKDREKHSLITVSRLAPEKHVDVIGNAIAIVQKQVPDVKLHVYGIGTYEKELKQIISDFNLQDNIILEGHSYDLDGPYENATMYISASTSEGFGLTYLESIAHGTPIFGLDAPYGVQEMTDNGTIGALIDFNRGDLKKAGVDLAELILKYIDDVDKLQELSDKAYEFSKNYSGEAVAKKYEEMLNSI